MYKTTLIEQGKKLLSGSNSLGFIGNLIGHKDPSTSYPHTVFLFQTDLVSVYQNSLFGIKEVQCNCESHKPGSRGKFRSCTYIIAKGQVQLKPGKQEKKEGIREIIPHTTSKLLHNNAHPRRWSNHSVFG